MISNKFSVFTKKQIRILNIVNSLQLAGGILLIVLAIVSSIPKWNGVLDGSYIIGLFMGVIGAAGILEIFFKTISHRKTVAYTLLLGIYKKKSLMYTPTQIQLEVCSWANKSIQDGKSILLYGKEDSGKTTSIFIYLSQYIKNKELIKNLGWVENVLYIDCKSNKSDILDFFNKENVFFKSGECENCLIIIDNIETMGENFLNQLLTVIRSSISTFILLADVCNIDLNKHNTVETKGIEENFSVSIYKNHADNFKHIFKHLSHFSQLLLLTIYYISMSLTLIPLQNIIAILEGDMTRRIIHRSLKELIHYNLIKEFPFDNHYILLVNQKAIFENQSIFWETSENTDVIMKIIKNSHSFPESAWLSFIHLPYEKQIQLNQLKREELFYNAIRCGNYLTLSKALNDELIYAPNKESLFYYEMGSLYFYNSQQEKAFDRYNRLLKKVSNSDLEFPLMLKIIETTHGDIDSLTRKNINVYLENLSKKGEPYSLYAHYWILHIKSESGIFDLNSYKQLLCALRKLDNNYFSDIHFEVIKRCYADMIRISHILFIEPQTILVDDFLNFLKKYYDESTWRYYNALYINANTGHYIRLMDKILKGQNCESIYCQAASNYETAIKTGYQNMKSVSACELKYIDLKVYIPDNLANLQQYKDMINKFLSNAEINKVSVHVAYCKTLMVKLCIISNLNNEDYYLSSEKRKKAKDSAIKTYIREAKKIYRDFDNAYGMVRLDFLETLYLIAPHIDDINKNGAIQKMTGILAKYPEYRRENTILDFIKNNSDSLSQMIIISLIRAYPIIMQ